MNEDMVRMRELEFAQRSLGIWGRTVPELFAFSDRENKEMVGHG